MPASDKVLTVLLLLAAAAAASLGRRALRHWRWERSGQVYELPVDRLGVALRAGAAGAAALVAVTLAVPLLSGSPSGTGTVATGTATVVAASKATAQPAASPTPTPLAAPPDDEVHTPAVVPPAPPIQTLGHPSGGTLQLLGDGTRVWLPPRYDAPRAADIAYPVVVARTDAPGQDGDLDLYEGFAKAADRGRADTFLLVMPVACDRDSGALLTEVAHHYRTLTARTAQAVLGIGTQAPCAVQEALAHPGRYRAGVGISGTYPPLAPTAGAYPSLLLASLGSEKEARKSARNLRDTLHPRGDAVRMLEGIGKRRDLMGLVAAYLTEKLDGPAKVSGSAPR
ncbi:MAG: hypothetical protein QOF98_1178 [Streptomyces sp.]|nr:hypothetical protein [Streptomyces sp.]